jgi:hypothetical protein
MSTAKAAIQNATVTGAGSMKGFWRLEIKHPNLAGKLEILNVYDVISLADGKSAFFGEVDTINQTALALQDGTVLTSNGSSGGEVVSFQITLDRAVYQFANGLRSPSNPQVISQGRILEPDREEGDAETGSWSAVATPIKPEDE